MQNNTELQIFLYLEGLTTPGKSPKFCPNSQSIIKCLEMYAKAFLDSREAVEYLDKNAGVWN